MEAAFAEQIVLVTSEYLSPTVRQGNAVTQMASVVKIVSLQKCLVPVRTHVRTVLTVVVNITAVL